MSAFQKYVFATEFSRKLLLLVVAMVVQKLWLCNNWY